MRDPRHDILFEPIQLGPVTAKNRFYQVPHCSGMGWKRPQTLAAMRGMKAEGGWGVVCTEYCSVHPTTDDGYYPYARLWDEDDIRAQALMTDQVHEHGALAGVELWLGGATANADTRLPALDVASRPVNAPYPGQGRRLDRSDIQDIRQWHGDAARRAIKAGFDIVYVYATHSYLLSSFLDPQTNERTDEYGGSLENRIRIVRELIEETGDIVAGKCAVATRFTVDETDEETYEAFSLLADLPDLWDLTIHDYGIEMGVSRFVKEGALEQSVARAKQMTSKPVVTVGRFTSPDTMARMVRSGVQDMIGAARPSIADPFLPHKIDEGRTEDIRECIGCNICYAHDTLGVPLRCTQNPTMGEEWRRGWHPEHMQPAVHKERVLVIGAGPAGLESARVLGERGFDVMLAEATRTLGGRVSAESQLPGLAEWARVRDWRVGQIDKLSNVEVFRESPMSMADALDVGARHILIATGATWTTDGVGRNRNSPFEISVGAKVVGADSILAGETPPDGRVLIFDDDHYYLGSVLALQLRAGGHDVVLVTPAGAAGQWTAHTNELALNNAALIDAGVEILTLTTLDAIGGGTATLSCVYSGRPQTIAADWVLPLTRREPTDSLYTELREHFSHRDQQQTTTVQRIGDCEAPGTIAAAVFGGYRAGVELQVPADNVLMRRE